MNFDMNIIIIFLVISVILIFITEYFSNKENSINLNSSRSNLYNLDYATNLNSSRSYIY